MKMLNLKTKVATLLIMLCFALPLLAQSDRFFRGGNDVYSNRDAGIGINGASTEYPTLDPFANGTGLGGANEEDPTPLGSGLLVLVAAGTVYSLRRTNMKNKKSQI